MQDQGKTLKKELEEAVQTLQELEKRLEEKADYGPGLGDPAVYLWELNLARRAEAQARVATIQEALRKLGEGRYGICTQCGAPIDPDRLEALPLATLCIQCARQEKRPRARRS